LSLWSGSIIDQWILTSKLAFTAMTVAFSHFIATKFPVKVNGPQNAYRGGRARSTHEPRKAIGNKVEKRKRAQRVRCAIGLVALKLVRLLAIG
jgi:hypothetical protein